MRQKPAEDREQEVVHERPAQPPKTPAPVERARVRLPRNRPDGAPLEIATLSFAVKEDGGCEISLRELLVALRSACGGDVKRPDLVLLSGSWLGTHPPADQILASSQDIPVMLEVGESGESAWFLFTRGPDGVSAWCLRDRQLVTGFAQIDNMIELQKQIAEGHGVIEVQGFPAPLVLLICGENNALAFNGGPSVVKGASGADLSIFKGDWILLNPAHRPYWPQVRSTGFGKVGTPSGMSSSMLERLVHQPVYPDGTRAPIAVLHANNYRADRPPTEDFSSCQFAGSRAHITEVPSTQPPGSAWRYARYSIAIP